MFKLNEENAREIEENIPEEGDPLPPPSTSQMSNPEMWVHSNQNILVNCRTTHAEPEVDDAASNPEDPEVLLAKIIAKDPYEPRLKSISQD